MPAYNEAEGLGEFIREIHHELRDTPHSFVVVDDASTDATPQVLEALTRSGLPLVHLRNRDNRGHGRSTLLALHTAVATGAGIVVAVDGDGQFSGRDVARLSRQLGSSDAVVAEGVRHFRSVEPYRRAISAATRLWVRSRCGAWPADANTPLRAYRADVLTDLLDAVPSRHMTPNLVMSVLSRTWGLEVLEVPVTCSDRRGSVSVGTTWGASTRHLPSRRLVTFCVAASVGLLTYPGINSAPARVPPGGTSPGRSTPHDHDGAPVGSAPDLDQTPAAP